MMHQPGIYDPVINRGTTVDYHVPTTVGKR